MENLVNLARATASSAFSATPNLGKGIFNSVSNSENDLYLQLNLERHMKFQ